jgi:hypothetical protein
MRTHWDRAGRYRGHSEGWPGFVLRMLGALVLLGWPWALGLGWAGWLVAVPVYALYAAMAYGHRKETTR